jgi:hypothetical protein
VKTVDKTETSKLDRRPMLAIAALVLVGAAIWAATALAAGGSSGTAGTASSSGDDGAQSYVVQDSAPDRGDCPEGAAPGDSDGDGSSELEGSNSSSDV